MKDLDNLMKSSFARLGEDLRPDVRAECETWRQRKTQQGAASAELYRGRAKQALAALEDVHFVQYVNVCYIIIMYYI